MTVAPCCPHAAPHTHLTTRLAGVSPTLHLRLGEPTLVPDWRHLLLSWAPPGHMAWRDVTSGQIQDQKWDKGPISCVQLSGSKVHLWEFVLPFLALFFLDSAAPAHGTLVPTGCPWGGAWHQGTQVTGEDEGPHGPLQEPRGKVIAEGKFQVLGGGGAVLP